MQLSAAGVSKRFQFVEFGISCLYMTGLTGLINHTKRIPIRGWRKRGILGIWQKPNQDKQNSTNSYCHALSPGPGRAASCLGWFPRAAEFGFLSSGCDLTHDTQDRYAFMMPPQTIHSTTAGVYRAAAIIQAQSNPDTQMRSEICQLWKLRPDATTFCY